MPYFLCFETNMISKNGQDTNKSLEILFDGYILKDEIIQLTGKALVENGIDEVEFRRVVVCVK